MKTLAHLMVGDKFEIVSLRDIYRNGVVLNDPNSTAVSVGIEHRDGVNEPWQREITRMATSVRVEYTGRAQTETDESGKEHVVMAAGEGGRRKSTEIKYPAGEFSVREIAEQNDVSVPTAYLDLKEKLSEGKIVYVREERRSSKGKSTKLYRLVAGS